MVYRYVSCIKIETSLYIGFMCLALLMSLGAKAKSDSIPFKPSGQPVLRVFSNFTAPLGESSGKTSFEVRRAYLGYDYELEKNWSMRIVLDIGSPNDDSPYSILKRYAYFKTASLTYKRGDWEFKGGIIDLFNVEYQEKIWDYRYVYKSFMDEYRFGPRADIGVNATWKASPLISFDMMVMNGEGYEQLQNDNTYKVSLGTNLTPIEYLLIRLYSDYAHKRVDEAVVSALVGYYTEKYALALEYNTRFNENFVQNRNRFGYSAYGRYTYKDSYGIFARYDWLSSSITGDLGRPWNLARDGSALLGGIEYRPIKNVRMSLNYQDWFPYAANVENRRSIYLNLEFKL